MLIIWLFSKNWGEFRGFPFPFPPSFAFMEVHIALSLQSKGVRASAMYHVGGGFLPKFWLGVCCPQLQMEPLARPIFVKMILLTELIST